MSDTEAALAVGGDVETHNGRSFHVSLTMSIRHRRPGASVEKVVHRYSHQREPVSFSISVGCGRIRRVCDLFIVAISASCAVSTASAQVRDLSVDEKRMLAAATVLAGTEGITNGAVAVDGADRATYNFGPAAEGLSGTVTFRRVQPCIYEMTRLTDQPGLKQREIIDFGRLTGRWHVSDRRLYIQSKGEAHCFQRPGRIACWPNYVFFPFSNVSSQRMIDDAKFLLRNGCGQSVTDDPY